MSSTGTFYLILALLAAAVLLSIIADRLKLPPAIPLVAGGIVLALTPGVPSFSIDPALTLVLFLPPLLLYAAYFTVWRDFKAELRPISMLALGAVAFSTAGVGALAHFVIPALPWAACFTLGAIVSPPDAVSAGAVFKQLSVPRRVQSVLQGESLVNDASALVLYRFAVAATLSGTFSTGEAILSLLWVAVGGIGIGVAIGYLVAAALRRLHDSRYVVVTTILAGYGAYVGAETVHASGVLAVVAAGLVIGWRQHEVLSAEARSESHAAWELVVFILEALIFVLIGLSLHGILDRLGGRARVWDQAIPLAALCVVGVIALRFVWVFLSGILRRLVPGSRDRDPMLSGSIMTIVSWAGMRGVVSLAAALALPMKFPGRDAILLATFAVIVTTVLVQGLTLGPLVKWLNLPPAEAHPDAAPTLSVSEARAKVNDAAVRALESIDESEEGTPGHAELLKEYRRRREVTEKLRDDEKSAGAESHERFNAALTATKESREEL